MFKLLKFIFVLRNVSRKVRKICVTINCEGWYRNPSFVSNARSLRACRLFHSLKSPTSLSPPLYSQTHKLLLPTRAHESSSDIMDSRQPNFFESVRNTRKQLRVSAGVSILRAHPSRVPIGKRVSITEYRGSSIENTNLSLVSHKLRLDACI